LIELNPGRNERDTKTRLNRKNYRLLLNSYSNKKLNLNQYIMRKTTEYGERKRRRKISLIKTFAKGGQGIVCCLVEREGKRVEWGGKANVDDDRNLI